MDHIVTKAKLVMNPFASIAPTFAEEADMSGPVAFCLALGFFLSLSGKFQFGVIYGQAITGCVSIYVVLNLMSEGGIDLYRCTSVVGYALLPMVVLSISMLVLPVKYVEAGVCLGRFLYEHGAVFVPWSWRCGFPFSDEEARLGCCFFCRLMLGTQEDIVSGLPCGCLGHYVVHGDGHQDFCGRSVDAGMCCYFLCRGLARYLCLVGGMQAVECSVMVLVQTSDSHPGLVCC